MKGPEKTRESMAGDEEGSAVDGLTPPLPAANRKDDHGANSVEFDAGESAALEHDLRVTLRPVALPAGFVNRVLATASAQSPGAANSAASIAADRSLTADSFAPDLLAPKSTAGAAKVLLFRSLRPAVGGAIAAGLLAGAFFAEGVHQRQERQHAAAVANQQFETATRITEQTLERTREQLRRAGVASLE